MTPDHAYRAGAHGILCEVCRLPEGNRQHRAKDVIVNGTVYGGETPPEVIDVLERSMRTGMRIRIHYGDTDGRDWGDVYDVTGRVGRSMGPLHIPLMVANARSSGGPGILDHCIVRIRHANRRDGGDLYRHPTYTPPPREDHPLDWDKHFA